MLKLPYSRINDRGYYNNEIQGVTYFNDYNQYSYINCFSEFPRNSALYVLKRLISFLNDSTNIYQNERVKTNNLSMNDILFANHTIRKYRTGLKEDEELDIDIEKMIDNDEFATLNVKFIDDVFFRFYFLEQSYFLKPERIDYRNFLDAEHILHEDYHCYNFSYSLASKLDSNKDVRIVNFFFDATFDDQHNYSLLITKVADAMLLEILRKYASHIPINTVTHFSPGYIFMPDFLTVDGIIFIYNYLTTLNMIYDGVEFKLDYTEIYFTNVRKYIINLYENTVYKKKTKYGCIMKYYYEYTKPINDILTGKDTNHIEDLYSAYKREMLG